MDAKKLHCSIGVMAYNEEKNIGRLLDSLIAQELSDVVIDEIIVISSGSTDKTNIIVREYSKKYRYIKLLVQIKRKGKSSAINLFIKNAKNDLLIVESADTLPAMNTVEKLISPFKNKKVGMTGGRPIPVNKGDDFVSFSVRLLWQMHHELAKFTPKLGEMVAFRKVFDQIPEESAVDEASIESMIVSRGFECLYVSDAIVSNKGPETLRDFIKQRRRIAIGHLWLKEQYNYDVASNNILLLFSLFVVECVKYPRCIIRTILTVKLEMFCRMLGCFDYKFRGVNPFIWEVSKSTKELNTPSQATPLFRGELGSRK